VAVGLSDFASTSHYTGNYLCKTRQMDRFLLAYGTPHW
jgi:hypothetical protein